jgi:hypothetical protein
MLFGSAFPKKEHPDWVLTMMPNQMLKYMREGFTGGE